MKKYLLVFLFGLVLRIFAGGSYVPVGTYLYADLEKLPDAPGRLELHFPDASDQRMVVAWGRKYRKDRKERTDTKEEDRNAFKPRLAKLSNNGKTATFEKLPADFYDIVVFDLREMTVHEGIALQQESQPGGNPAWEKEIQKSLGLREDRIGGWEGFFDTKQHDRLEFAGERAGVFLQQMRLGKAVAESGKELQGTVHSVDVVWVERANNGEWQVLNRQQLLREELPSKTFFQHTFTPQLSGIRVGSRPKTIRVSLTD
ncbi:MAG: hypothetical protein IJJ26_00500 [Victivallales bacterium]|nr:hypothetical protein [Victivallales bacterium]